MSRRNLFPPALAAATLASSSLASAPVAAQARAPWVSCAPTYPEPGTVGTQRVDSPGVGGGLVVMDVQRDLAPAHEALAEVEASTSERLAALDRIDVLFPDARTVHPGHGASGAKAMLLTDQRGCTVTTRRRLALAEFVRSGATPGAKAAANKVVVARFSCENPSGPRGMVAISVDRLFTEPGKPELAPVEQGPRR